MLTKALMNAQMKNRLANKTASAFKQATRSFSQHIGSSNEIRNATAQDSSIAATEQYLQFSKAPIMKNYGELPLGEIPEPLKFERPMETTTISNGIRVCTEKMATSSVAAFGVFIGAGSRNETLESSGSAHFLEHLHFKGTKKRTRH